MSKSDDAQLVREALTGDMKAFERLIDKYQRPLYNAALRMTGDRDDAGDIVQTVFIRVYENLESYDPKYKFFSWVYRMMMNEAINFINRNKPKVSLNQSLVSDEPRPDEKYASKRLSQCVEDAIAELPLDYRVAIIFRHWADLPYRDIGFILDIPEKTVKSRLYSARRMLAELLSKRGLLADG